MCLVLTDGLQLFCPVTTIRSNTNICNHSPDGSSKVGLCKYTMRFHDYSGIQCNHDNCYFKIITLNEPNPLAYYDL